MSLGCTSSFGHVSESEVTCILKFVHSPVAGSIARFIHNQHLKAGVSLSPLIILQASSFKVGVLSEDGSAEAVIQNKPCRPSSPLPPQNWMTLAEGPRANGGSSFSITINCAWSA